MNSLTDSISVQRNQGKHKSELPQGFAGNDIGKMPERFIRAMKLISILNGPNDVRSL